MTLACRASSGRSGCWSHEAPAPLSVALRRLRHHRLVAMCAGHGRGCHLDPARHDEKRDGGSRRRETVCGVVYRVRPVAEAAEGDGIMVAYSFQRRFVAPILARTKRQTIRAERKRHARPGEMVSLYQGMRTKQCKLIALAPCVDVQPIRLQFAYPPFAAFDGRQFKLLEGLDDFARADGFEDWAAMRLFWEEQHPDVSAFSGVLIRWGDLA